jgi:hypothetical protein
MDECSSAYGSTVELKKIKFYLETNRNRYDYDKTVYDNMTEYIKSLTDALNKFTSPERLAVFENMCRVQTLAAELKATTTVEEYMCKMVDLVREIDDSRRNP